ncbi:four-jointed box protein 1 [Bombina bombina]|uniref:four-jointed box protein 1 n=1 Tax=Bombina bombina TaxID=8345 RepID=UPI00235B21C0|nr:four-jointed box protein 1 [Bombina bombina]
MKAVGFLLPSGLLFVLGTALWGRRGDQSIVKQEGHLPQKAPWVMHLSGSVGHLPTSATRTSYSLTAPDLSARTSRRLYKTISGLSAGTSRAAVNETARGLSETTSRTQYNKANLGLFARASGIQYNHSVLDLLSTQTNNTARGVFRAQSIDGNVRTSKHSPSVSSSTQYNQTGHGLYTGTGANTSSNFKGDGNTGKAGPLNQGIYWTEALEQALPHGFPQVDVLHWQESARSAQIISLEWGCGRSTNRVATLSDGSRVCVRYGINQEQIQGEALSFYLSRLLGLHGVPPCVLSRVGSSQWAPVLTELGSTGWTQGALVTLTPWIHNLTMVVPPQALHADSGHLRPLHEELEEGYEWVKDLDIAERTSDSPARDKHIERPARVGVIDLAQWADLIVFDYLTANFDRLVSNLFSLQWDPRIMLRGTNNLHRAPDGTLVMLDNEAGLVHGYRLRDTWDKYNEQLLATVCLFRRGVMWKLRELHIAQSAVQELHILYQRAEPLAAELGFLTEAQGQILQDRVGNVYKHVLNCQDKYS